MNRALENAIRIYISLLQRSSHLMLYILAMLLLTADDQPNALFLLYYTNMSLSNESSSSLHGHTSGKGLILAFILDGFLFLTTVYKSGNLGEVSFPVVQVPMAVLEMT